MFKHAFKPGNKIPKAATYWVHHYQHRMSHLAFIDGRGIFPECIKCGTRVRFELSPDQQQAEPITSDPDFGSGGDRAATG